jgi:hypothetical protein
MKSAVQAGVVLGVTVLVWTLIHGFTGWYKDPAMSQTFWIVIPIQVILMVWMLRKTKALGYAYGQQVMAGVVMSLVAGVIIFAGSYVITTVVFPTYYEDMKAMAERIMVARGLTPDQVQTGLAKQASLNTPLVQSFMGFIGTFVTGLLVSLIGAAFIRHRATPIA